jgi:non-ribosomal peptide synthetase component F
LLELPADRPRPVVPTFRGGRLARLLAPGLDAQLRAVSRREGVTEFMAVLAAFQVLLYHMTGRTDLLVGTDIAGRNRVELETAVGFFANQLPLRADLSGQPSFRDVLRRVREVTLEAYDWQDLPFDWLVEALQPVRNLGHSPLIQVKLNFQHVPAQKPMTSDLTVTPFELARQTAQLDLIVTVNAAARGLGIVVEYSRDLFDEARIRRLIDDLEALLGAALARPEMGIDELASALAAAERQRRLAAQEDRRQARLGKLGTLLRKAPASSEGIFQTQGSEDA